MGKPETVFTIIVRSGGIWNDNELWNLVGAFKLVFPHPKDGTRLALIGEHPWRDIAKTVGHTAFTRYCRLHSELRHFVIVP